jgi:hypothetical protein
MRPRRRAFASIRVLLAATVASVALWAAVPAAAQDDPDTHPLCLLSLDEMSALVGVPMVERSAAGLECAYTTDPAQRAIQVVLAIIPPDPTALEPAEDGLMVIRWDTPGGIDQTIGDLPAWVAPDGVWIDVGADVLAVLPLVLFDADPPPMPETAVAIAEAAMPRYLAAPRPSAAPTPPPTGLVARFPAELAGQALDVTMFAGPDLFALLGALASGDPALGVADLQAAVEGLAGSLDAASGAIASVYDFDTDLSLSITAIQVPGADVMSLVEPATRAFVDFAGGVQELRAIGGRDVTHIAPPEDGGGTDRWVFADGDVLWALDGDEPLVEALLTTLPAPGGAG